MKTFAWKAAKNILPVRQNLIKKTAAACFDKMSLYKEGRASVPSPIT